MSLLKWQLTIPTTQITHANKNLLSHLCPARGQSCMELGLRLHDSAQGLRLSRHRLLFMNAAADMGPSPCGDIFADSLSSYVLMVTSVKII